MSEERVEQVRRALAAWNRGDVDAWLEGAHPEVEWISEIGRRLEGSDRAYRGLAGLREYWDDWHATWDVHIDLTDTIDAGETVIAIANVTTRGEASGIDLEQPVAYVFEFEDGLARRVRSYFDPQQALDAAGVKPASGNRSPSAR